MQESFLQKLQKVIWCKQTHLSDYKNIETHLVEIMWYTERGDVPSASSLQVSRWGKGLDDTTPATSGGSLNKVRQRNEATVHLNIYIGVMLLYIVGVVRLVRKCLDSFIKDCQTNYLSIKIEICCRKRIFSCVYSVNLQLAHSSTALTDK